MIANNALICGTAKEEKTVRKLKQLVDELVILNDDNLAHRVIDTNDVQWCLSEMQDILEHNISEKCKTCKFADRNKKNDCERRVPVSALLCRNVDYCGDEPLIVYEDDYCSRWEADSEAD